MSAGKLKPYLRKEIIMKKILTIAAIVALTATSTMNTTAYAADVPTISVSIVGENTIISGDSAEYTIIYEGDVSLVTISEKSIGLEGFSADKVVTLNDDNTATLSLTNIVDLEGGNIIHIAGGTATTSENIMAEEVILKDIVIADNPSTGSGIPIFTTIVSAVVAAFAFHNKKK